MALAAKAFWGKKGKNFKSRDNTRGYPSGQKLKNTRARSCYNCGYKTNFIADCPYEKREDNGGRLIPKNKTKLSAYKKFGKKNFPNKKVSTRVLVSQEEYMSGGEEESEEEVVGVAAIATTSTPSTSLFDSPNENTANNSHKCLMAKASKATYSSRPISNSTISLVDDEDSLKVKCEVVGLDEFMSNLEGATKVHLWPSLPN
jgi:hypothetical protein